MSANARRADIDGLRAFSVLAVTAYHLGIPGINGGFVGVDIFFVISGFVITQSIMRDQRQGAFSLWRFYARRVRRILPALVVVVVAVQLFALLLLFPSEILHLSQSAIAALFGLSNLYFLGHTGYFDPDSDLLPLLHTWSLGVEEQFYFVFPALMALCHRFRKAGLLALLCAIFVASLLLNLYFSYVDVKIAFFAPFTRAWELVLGVVLALIPVKGYRWLSYLGLSGLVASVILIDTSGPYPGYRALLPSISAALVIMAPIRALTWRPIVLVGEASYSLYLWHWPVIVFFTYQAGHPPTVVHEYLAIGALIAALSFASWAWIERPVLRTPNFDARRTVGAAMLGVLLVSALPAGLLLAAGAPWRFTPRELAIIESIPERGVAYDAEGKTCSSRPVENACVIGDVTATPDWALIGDSHAETLMNAVASQWARRGVSGYVFTYPGCPFIEDASRLDNGFDCGPFVEAVVKELTARHIRHVIIQDRANAYMVGTPFDNGEGGVEPGPTLAVDVPRSSSAPREPAVAAALADTIRQLLDQGITVYYLLAPPEIGWHVPRQTIDALRKGGAPVTTSLDRYMERNAPLISVLEGLSTDNLFVIQSYRAFCDELSRRCATSDEALLYTDTDHLSVQGAEALAHEVFSVVDAAKPLGSLKRLQ